MDNQRRAKEMRVFAEEIRLLTFREFAYTGFGHIGGAMSVIETLAVLYGSVMRYDPKRPDWVERDKLVVSKGHAGPAVYATLALRGFFAESMLSELNRGGGRLPSHCDRNKTPGIDMTTGSLGQGVSVAVGIALGDRMDGRKSKSYVIVGDGELNEGQNWEGFMFAAHNKLDNLCVLIDNNGQQLDGETKSVMDMGDISEKMRAFGFFTQDVDGHDTAALLEAFGAARSIKSKPSAIVLHTVKGRGCTFAEGVLANHHMTFTGEQIAESIKAAEAELLSAQTALKS